LPPARRAPRRTASAEGRCRLAYAVSRAGETPGKSRYAPTRLRIAQAITGCL